ncbi:MAG TPA: hypothetical protein VGJ13_00705 [Pseudonocardiaceae bacterium]
MTAPHSAPSPEDTTRTTRLNLTHVLAAALAAVTAAVLASRLGAAGTLIGAAGASVTTTISTTMYQASLERSRDRVHSLAQRTRSLPISRHRSRAERSHISAANDPPDEEQLTDSIDGSGSGPQPADRPRRIATLRWAMVAVAALGAFGLAMMGITGFEWASGETIGGNGKGTTIGRVVDAPAGPQNPAIPPAPHSSNLPTSETPAATTTAPVPVTINPDGTISVEQSPPTTSGRPVPSKVSPVPPLIPPALPGIGR